MNPQPKKNVVRHLFNAIGHSLNGLKHVWRLQLSFRIEAILSFFIIPCAIWLAQSWIEFALLLGSWLLILIIEVVNSAIEVTIDRISLEHHELSGRAKDYGSAAVFLACVNAVIIWGIKLFY